MFTRKRIGMLVMGAAVVLIVVWLTFSWFEAGTEVEVLCSNFHTGWSEDSVRRTLETGEYLQYQVVNEGRRIEIDSHYNLRTTKCIVELSPSGVVTEAHVE